MNKPLNDHLPTDSIVEFLFAPLSDEATPSGALLIEPHGNLVRKFDREELAFLVSQFARGMSATNLKRGSRVALSCKISVKAVVASFANLLNGAVNVILPPHLELKEQLQALSSSRTECLIVDDFEAALPILQNIKTLPQLRQVIVLSEAEFDKQPEILSLGWRELMKRGEAQPDKISALRQAIEPEHDAFLYFHHDAQNLLSGVLQTHFQVVAELRDMLEEESATLAADKLGWERMLSLIPFHHPHSQIAAVLLPMALNRSCMLLDPKEEWKAETLTSRSTLLIAEASFFENLADKVEQQVSQEEGLAEKAWNIALSLGEKIMDDENVAHSLISKCKIHFCRAMLAGKLKNLIGGNLQTAIVIDRQPKLAATALQLGMGANLIIMHSKPQEMLAMPAA